MVKNITYKDFSLVGRGYMKEDLELKILKMIAKKHLLTKTDLIKFLEENGVDEDPKTVVESITKSLMQKQYITSIEPIGSTCYMITREGTKFLNGL